MNILGRAMTSAALAAVILPATFNGALADGFGDYRRASKLRLLECVRSYLTELQIGHSSDNESSFQDPNTLEEKILNYAAVNEGIGMLAKEDCVPYLHLTAGDHTLPGPFYQASAEVPFLGEPGLGDILMYNGMGLDGNGMGNHEFDGTIDEFATMLRKARYPFIAVNLDFSEVTVADDVPDIRVGPNAAWCGFSIGKVTRSCWIVAGGQKVGLIGRAPADFFNVIANPEVTLGGLDFVGGRDPDTDQPLVSAVGQVLEQVDRLEAQGVKRIILIDHAQDFTADPLSTGELRGIDIIVPAGSTGFMANTPPNGPFGLLRDGDVAQADYPTIREDSEGRTVLVVNSDQQYRYLGSLRAKFDHAGHIVGYDTDVTGPVPTTAQGVDALERVVRRNLEAPRLVRAVFSALQETPLIQDSFVVIGMTSHPLNGLRDDVRSRETNLGRVAADSTLWYTRQQFPALGVDVALKNGGGIRDSILGPVIIKLTIGAALAFDNQLAIVELTADQLLAAMENAVSRVPALDGRFPQIAGMQLTYDPSQPGIEGLASVTVPSRIVDLVITRANGDEDVLVAGGVAQGDLGRTFVMATNNFLLTGGDGYASLAAGGELAVTAIGEQQILADYIATALLGLVDEVDPPVTPRVVSAD